MLKLEAVYWILKDYKDVVTSEKYLCNFVDRFLEGRQKTPVGEITPEEIEHWLDVELDADSEHITGQKQDHL